MPQHDLTVSVNAYGGYTVHVREGTELIDHRGNAFDDVSGSNAAPAAFPGPAVEAFGYTTDDATLGTGTADRFTSGGPKWAGLTTTNAEVAYNSGPDYG